MSEEIRETMEKKCPYDGCGSLDVDITKEGVADAYATEEGSKISFRKFISRCHTCTKDFWFIAS